MKSTSEYVFHKNINPDDLDMILSNVYLITPNIPEAKILFGENFTFEQLRKQSEINYANILWFLQDKAMSEMGVAIKCQPSKISI